MRLAGPIVGCLVLGAFVIPGSYMPNPGFGGAAGTAAGFGLGSQSAAPRGSAVLAGRVYGPLGTPVEGAEVSLAGSGFWPPRAVRSGVEGRFYWQGLPPGIYELRATLGTLSSPTVEGLILDRGSRRLLALELAEGWTLSGRVSEADGDQPIEGARVVLATGPLGAYKRTVTTDARGRFELEGVFGDEHQLFVDREGYVPEGPRSIRKEQPDVLVELERGSSIGGAVVDEAGRPIAGAQVRLLGAAGSRSQSPTPANSLGVTEGPVPPISADSGDSFAREAEAGATTSADGGFRIEGLKAGTYTAVATHPNYVPKESPEVVVGAGRSRSDLRLVLALGGELRGRVVDARRVGLAGIPVELRMPDERLPRMTVTSEDGSFAYRGVRGDALVTAVPYDLQPAQETVTVEGGRVEVLLVLARELLSLVGRATDERGFGIDGAVVTVTTLEAVPPTERTSKTGVDGAFSVPALPEPPYAVRVEHPAYSTVRIERLESADPLEVTLRSGVTVRGTVADDWSGAEVADVRVRLDGSVERSGRTNGRGVFRFQQLPPGVYELAFEHADYEPLFERVEVRSPQYVDRPQELQEVRLTPGGRVEGEVRDAYGEPVPEAEVAAGLPPDWAASVKTDREGRFVIRGLSAGSTWISARHPSAGEATASNPLLVRPKEVSPGAYVKLPSTVQGADD